MTPKGERRLAVLPARGGSKRIPRKNIRAFCGIPLLGRTIDLVKKSRVFDAVVVSTDDEEIARIARDYGALVPFIRPAPLSDDWTGTAPVVAHTIDAVAEVLGDFISVCCVYPGAALMTEEDFIASSALLHDATGRDAIVAAVVRYGHPIQRALRLGENGVLVPAGGRDVLSTRTQDLQPMWHDAGQFYWASPERWKSPDPLLSSVIPYEVPSWRVQDIDTEDDWIRAEMIFSMMQLRGSD